MPTKAMASRMQPGSSSELEDALTEDGDVRVERSWGAKHGDTIYCEDDDDELGAAGGGNTKKQKGSSGRVHAIRRPRVLVSDSDEGGGDADEDNEDDEGDDSSEGVADEGEGAADVGVGAAEEGAISDDDEAGGAHPSFPSYENGLTPVSFTLTTKSAATTTTTFYYVDRTSDGDDTTGHVHRVVMSGALERLVRVENITKKCRIFSTQETGGAATFSRQLESVVRAGDVVLFASTDRPTREGPEVFTAFVRAFTERGVLVGTYLIGDAAWRVVEPAGGSPYIRLLSFFNAQAITASLDSPLKVTSIGPAATDQQAMDKGVSEAVEAKLVRLMYASHSAALGLRMDLIKAFEHDRVRLPPHVDVARRVVKVLLERYYHSCAFLTRSSTGTSNGVLDFQRTFLEALGATDRDPFIVLKQQSASQAPIAPAIKDSWRDLVADYPRLLAAIASTPCRFARHGGLEQSAQGIDMLCFAGLHQFNASAAKAAIMLHPDHSAATVLLGKPFDGQLECEYNALVTASLKLLLQGRDDGDHSKELVAPVVVSLTKCHPAVLAANEAFADQVLGARRYLAGKAPHTRLGMTAPPVLCDAVSDAVKTANSLADLARAAAAARAEADAQLRRAQARGRAQEPAHLPCAVAQAAARADMIALAAVQQLQQQAAVKAEQAATKAQRALVQPCHAAGLPAPSSPPTPARAPGALSDLVQSAGMVESADLRRAFQLGRRAVWQL